MRKFVGVLSLFSQATDLKQEALIFDRIAIPEIENLLYRVGEAINKGLLQPSPNNLLPDLIWLIERGIVFQPSELVADERLTLNADFRNYLELESYYENEMKRALLDTNDDIFTRLNRSDDYRWKAHEFFVRRVSVQLRLLNNLDAYPILPTELSVIQETPATRQEILQIVLTSLPIPDGSVSWEQIIDYRSDPDSQKKFLALRKWISEVARGQLTPLEVEEKLEWLISQYEEHLDFHKIKRKKGIMQIAIVASLEIMEDMLRFQWGKIAKALFFLKHQRLALMEEEIKAPGKELAYIIKTRNQFSE